MQAFVAAVQGRRRKRDLSEVEDFGNQQWIFQWNGVDDSFPSFYSENNATEEILSAAKFLADAEDQMETLMDRLSSFKEDFLPSCS